MLTKFFALAALTGAAVAQQVGTQTTETHPKMSWQKCSAGGSCTTQQGEVTIDSNWRWVHDKGGYTNCYTGNEWNTTICADSKTCASNCALDGADYSATYGASTSGNALTLKFVTKGQYGGCPGVTSACDAEMSSLLTSGLIATNIGSRLYLMASSSKYQMFTLLGNEFTFDVDVSKLG
jgi:cellulose 1,4-beta-cellobiosidase